MKKQKIKQNERKRQKKISFQIKREKLVIMFNQRAYQHQQTMKFIGFLFHLVAYCTLLSLFQN